MNKKRPFAILGTVVLAATITMVAASCTSNTAASQDQSKVNNQLNTFEQTQPIPFNNWSQYRQTLIDVEQAEIHGVATTSFFFNTGVQDPIKMCPSIGYAVSATSQLTNPTQVSNGGQNPNTSNENVTIDQSEPNGAYTGQSTGTYVVCVSPDGTKRPDYWEGWVETEPGAAHWDSATHQIIDDGHTTVNTKTNK